MPERLISHEDFGALAGDVLAKGGTFQFQAHGKSMRPFIFNGEIISISSVDPARLRRGDIVLCWLTEEKLVLHRVVSIQKTQGRRMFTIQGDAGIWPDGMVPARNILGVARSVRRGEKWVALDAFPMRFLAWVWMLGIRVRRMGKLLGRSIRRICKVG